MGDFFLFRRGADLDLESVAAVFRDKGYPEPFKESLPGAELWVFPKSPGGAVRGFADGKGNRLWWSGTLVYRGKDALGSGAALLEDLAAERVSGDELLGAFCVIAEVGGRIVLLTDYRAIYQVFVDDAAEVVSSSFLAVVHSRRRKWAVNRPALLDNLLLGFPAGAATIVRGVQRADRVYQMRASAGWFRFFQPTGTEAAALPEVSREQSLHRVREQLERAMGQVKAFCRGEAQMGLSGGFDSRLLLALAIAGGWTVEVFTHGKGSGDRDQGIAARVAGVLGAPFRVLRRQELRSLDDSEIQVLVEDAFHFFDGRVGHGGWLSDDKTRRYRLENLSLQRTLLGGFGGEVLRNHLGAPLRPVRLKDWICQFALKPQIWAAVKEPQRSRATARVTAAVQEALGMPNLPKAAVKFEQSQRYYTDFFLPNNHGPRCNAENRLFDYLAPFTFPAVVREGLAAAPHVGADGAFEAALIARVNLKAAAVPSAYGVDFARPSRWYLAKSYVRASLPLFWRQVWGRRRAGRASAWGLFRDLTAESPVLMDAAGRLTALNLPLDWSRYMASPDYVSTALSLGVVLDRLSDRLDFGGGDDDY